MDVSFSLTEEDNKELDDLLQQAMYELVTHKNEEPGWIYVTLAIPADFHAIFEETLDAYKKVRETDKTFPALEALIMEARNSLPQEFLTDSRKTQ